MYSGGGANGTISKLLAVNLKDLIADTEEREDENCK